MDEPIDITFQYNFAFSDVAGELTMQNVILSGIQYPNVIHFIASQTVLVELFFAVEIFI